MGTYYTPIIIREKNDAKTIQKFYSHDYDNGLKLMEHSYMGNNFVETVAMQLYKKPGRLAWVSDYADNQYLEDLRAEGKIDLVDKFKEFTEIEKLEDDMYCRPKEDRRKNCLTLYLYNHSKKELVDCYDFFVQNCYYDGDWCMCVHPLPLLTAIGNGYGGGDYGTEQPDADKIGCWAGDIIEVAPYKEKEYKSYKNITKELHWTDKYERSIPVKEAIKIGSIIEYVSNDPFEKDKTRSHKAVVLDSLSDAAITNTATIPFTAITKVWNLDEVGNYKLEKLRKQN